MTINIADNNPRVSYSLAAGITQTSFAVPFEFFDETDVLVYIDSTLKTLSTDYTVSGGNGSVGTITMSVTGPATVALVRDVTIERSTDFPTAGPFSVQSLNVELDKQIAIDADISDQIDRSVRSPIEEFTTMTLPNAATRADKLLKFDTDGNVAVESASALVGGAVVGANFVNNTFTGDGSQTAFTTTVQAGSKNNAQVYIDGVYQLKSSFSVSANTLTFTEAPPLNSQIEVIIGNALDTIAGDAGNVDYNQGGTGAQTRTVESKLQEFVSVVDYNLVGDGTTDNTAAFNALIAAIPANSQSPVSVYFPSGSYYFNSQPNNISQGIRFFGDGVARTLLYRNFSPTGNDGLFNFRQGANGSSISNLGIVSTSGTSGGCLISLVASSSGAPDFCRFNDLYLTSANSDNYKIFIDGSARTTGAIGVRDTFISNSSIFGGATGSVYAKGAIALSMTNTDTFPAGGTSGKIVMTGDATVNSYYFQCDGGVIDGFSLDNLQYAHIHASVITGNITNASTASNVMVHSTATGTVQSNWVSSIYQSPFAVQGSQQFTGSVTSTTGVIGATRTSGSVTNIGHVGNNATTTCANGNETFSFVNPSGKLFMIGTGGGAAALVFADYKQTTITLLANPSSEFEASGTPTAGKTGITKSANSHTINVICNVGSTTNYTIMNLDQVSSTTDPA